MNLNEVGPVVCDIIIGVITKASRSKFKLKKKIILQVLF